jgi:hypothetical protein
MQGHVNVLHSLIRMPTCYSYLFWHCCLVNASPNFHNTKTKPVSSPDSVTIVRVVGLLAELISHPKPNARLVFPDAARPKPSRTISQGNDRAERFSRAACQMVRLLSLLIWM